MLIENCCLWLLDAQTGGPAIAQTYDHQGLVQKTRSRWRWGEFQTHSELPPECDIESQRELRPLSAENVTPV